MVKGVEGVMRGSSQLEFRRREMETVVGDLKEKDEFSILTASRKGGKIEFLLDRVERREDRNLEANFRANSCTDSREWERVDEKGSQTIEQY